MEHGRHVHRVAWWGVPHRVAWWGVPHRVVWPGSMVGIHHLGYIAPYTTLGIPTLHYPAWSQCGVLPCCRTMMPWAQDGDIPWVGGSHAPHCPKGVKVGRRFCALLLRSSRR